jgi:parvulin-like peptidyl-prolyl isomerase
MKNKKIILIMAIAVAAFCIVISMRTGAVQRTQRTYEGVALVNQQTITKDEFRDYARASKIRQHFAGLSVENLNLEELLNDYIREQILMYQDAERQGIFETEGFRRAYQLGEDRMSTARYLTGQMREIIEVTEDDLSDHIPREWKQLKIRQILLLDRGQAAAVLAEARAGKDFIELVREYSVGPAQNKDGDIGYRFPETGYFLPADDVYLFTLEAGDISDIVETPLGPAVCKIEDVKVYTEEEIEYHLSQPRKVIFNQKVQAHIQGIREAAGFKIHTDALYQCVETMQEVRREDALIAETGTRKFYFSDLQRTIKRPYDQIYIDPSVEQLFSLYKNDLSTRISEYLLAQEARILGVGIETEAEKAELSMAARRIALRMMAERLFADMAVTPEKAEEYFLENPDEFNIPERVRVWQILMLDEESAGLMHDRLNAGEDFKKLAHEHSMDERSKITYS